jgi:excisionase family DNA binding protein
MAYTMQETATLLGVSYITIQRLVSRGLLKASKAIRKKIIAKEEIIRFLNETSEQFKRGVIV